jgi:hypothetical protein
VIGPGSNLFKLSESVKLFNIRPNEEEKRYLESLSRSFTELISEDFRMSINFFKDGETIHGEALLGHQETCILARDLGINLIDVADSIKSKVISKFMSSKYKGASL